jgi:hypothetical protein
VAAKAMLGQDAKLDMVPYFYTDQFDVAMEYSGFPTLAAGNSPLLRGSMDDGSFLAFWLNPGASGKAAVVAGMSINQPKVHKTIKALISRRVQVDPARLADPDVPLEDLLPED